MNILSHHIPFAKLADLAENRLLPDERAASFNHISACSRCAAQVARLEQIMGLMRTDMQEDAPPDTVARAVALFRAEGINQKEPSVVRRILAALSFDSTQLSPAFGVRSGQTAARQLLYTAGENDLDLRIAPKGETWIVSGQVLGECAGGQVELQGAMVEAHAELNDLCEFILPPVPTGSYALRLHLTHIEVEISDFELRP